MKQKKKKNQEEYFKLTLHFNISAANKQTHNILPKHCSPLECNLAWILRKTTRHTNRKKNEQILHISKYSMKDLLDK